MILSEVLLELEMGLQDPALRRNAAELEGLLAQDFREFGSSGRVFSRDEIVQALGAETPVRFQMEEFAVEMVSAEVALVTYRARTERAGRPVVFSLRSSLWRWRESAWEMVFHQGTKIPAEGE